eukprot:TRINITY_DN30635_c0_g1_i1.p2 TRINITY_DN30635_c0_g1~~TRINITY_DN30635_c0_g1_i1.p2  ORF type:complete len:336 (+),score=108.19 TRINITY_DN30635_c0_g1_i1:38-1009(+)
MQSLEAVLGHVESIRTAVAAEVQALEQGRAELREERAAFEEEKRLFEVEKRALRDRLHRGSGLVAPIKGEVVELNVGGTHFTTSLTTLLAEPESALAKMFQQPSAIPLDPEGRFFLDYAGAPFDYVLKYLRGERFFVRKHDPIVAEVYSLAHKLGLAGFISTLEVVLRGMKDAKAPEPAPAPRAPSPQPAHDEQGSVPPVAYPTDAYRAPADLSVLRPHRDAFPSVHTRPPSPQLGPASPPGWSGGAPPVAAPLAVGTPDVQRVDPALHGPLRRALDRQRTKNAKQLGVEQLDQVRLAEAGQRAEDSWELHWQGIHRPAAVLG